MKVLIASADYTPDGGGIGAYSNGLWRGLRAAGCDASVLTRATAARRQTGTERMVAVVPGRSLVSNLRALRTWYLALKNEVLRRKCKWVVIPTWDPVGLAATLPLLRRALPCRIAIVLHGADVASAKGRKARLLRHVLQSADQLIANSSYTGGLIARRFGATSYTVRPGIGEADLDVSAQAPRSPFNVVTVGRLIPRKGHALVLEAVARLTPEYNDLTYTIVGEGPERAAIEALARSLHITERLHMTGHVSAFERRRYLSAASVFAMPVLHYESDPEGFGIVYLEAGAACLPVLATRSGGVTESVIEGESGLFCEPNVASVTNALRRLLENPALRFELGNGGRRVVEGSGWDRRAQDLLVALSGPRPEVRKTRVPHAENEEIFNEVSL